MGDVVSEWSYRSAGQNACADGSTNRIAGWPAPSIGPVPLAAEPGDRRKAVLSLSALFALLPLMSLAPATAWGDFYQWTDEQGIPVLSNIRPPNPGELRDFQLVMKEPDRPPQNDPGPQRETSRNEQMLLDRIEVLERHLHAQRLPAQPQPLSSVAPARYYASPPPPPPAHHGGYYPAPYFPWLPSYS